MDGIGEGRGGGKKEVARRGKRSGKEVVHVLGHFLRYLICLNCYHGHCAIIGHCLLLNTNE